ncbi:uncharacterized protein BJ212DRAFT_627280 [Suillus subaureus]|uniref:Uncharacterized protein n=1 Tax=Suillus subaureus TaxID=48587 RepID=A0A9P7ATF3_9AGAM|nr:uncharacterized protein BJ212DRAFT_627280 [Suillus subaureus]KAG1794764.1 hypothetical protein BJ212DRAFT_627280 [Suillus subaureus]
MWMNTFVHDWKIAIGTVMLSITLFPHKVTHAKWIHTLNYFSLLTWKGKSGRSLTKNCQAGVEAQIRRTRTSSPGKKPRPYEIPDVTTSGVPVSTYFFSHVVTILNMPQSTLC